MCNVQNVIDDLIGHAQWSRDVDDTYFLAPETTVFGTVYASSDIYALSCCFLHFILIHELKITSQAQDVAQAQHYVPALRQLVQMCMLKDPQDRLTAEELLQLVSGQPTDAVSSHNNTINNNNNNKSTNNADTDVTVDGQPNPIADESKETTVAL